jgi:hypothetical protein
MKRLSTVFAALVLTSSLALAETPTAVDRALLEALPAPALRARLAALAGQLAGTNRGQAARAWQLHARSALRSGLADSAVTAAERAAAMQGSAEDVAVLASALVARGRPGDVHAARARLEAAARGADVPHDRELLLGRLAMTLEAMGRRDSALTVWRSALIGELDPVMRRRQALALGNSTDATDRARAAPSLSPFVSASRGQDTAAVRALAGVGGVAGARANEARIRRGVGVDAAREDAREQVALAALGAVPAPLVSTEGSPLGAFTVRSSGARAGAAVIVADPGAPLDDSDSLAAVLMRAGWNVALVHPLGSGPSCSGTWPAPWAAQERPDAWTAAGARDVRAAVRALAAATACDTTRVLLAVGGRAVAIGAEAAALDPRVRRLVITSPEADDIARAPLLARLTRRAPAVYIEMAPEDLFAANDFADALFHAGAAGGSRISESGAAVRGHAQWREDEAGRARFTRWLAEPVPPAPRATPRPARR